MTGEGKWIIGARSSLLENSANPTARQLARLVEAITTSKRMYCAFLCSHASCYCGRSVDAVDARIAPE